MVLPSQGRQQAEEMDLQGPYEVQQREMPAPAPGEENPKQQYMLGADQLESSLEKKNLGV